MAPMNYLLYLIFGLLPSFIWLAYYLRKDVHPESTKMILKIFFFGMLMSIPAALLELGIFEGLQIFGLPEIFTLALYFFFGVAVVEETFKYLVVKEEVISNPEFDEPLDAMLYMIISALGFAAFENILILFNLGRISPLEKIFTLTAFRFVGATLLHALCSGTIGYFLALSFFAPKKRKGFLFTGFVISIGLHGLYNFSIIQMKEETETIFSFLIIGLILISLALLVSLGFSHLKKIKSICKI